MHNMMFMFGNFSGDPTEPFAFPIADADNCLCEKSGGDSDEGLQLVVGWKEIYKERLIAYGHPFHMKQCHWGGHKNKDVHVVIACSLNSEQIKVMINTSVEIGNVYKTCIMDDTIAIVE